MEWSTVSTISTSDSYVFTPSVTGTVFKFKHITNSPTRNKLKVIIRQSFNDGTDLHLFDYRLINASLDKSILFINKPKELLTRTLAIKRADTFLNQFWTIEVQTLINDAVTDMPAYPSDPSSPIFNGATKAGDESMVAVNNVDAVLLSASDLKKIGTMITNRSTSNLYISLSAIANFTNYDKILGPGEVFETPFNWCGEIYGIWDQPDISENGHAKVKDFRFVSNVVN